MKFTPTTVSGAFVINVDRIGDSRGYFGRMWCEKELSDNGLLPRIRQVNVGFSPQAGTLRGLHYQEQPFEEVKIVRCTRGGVYDVVLDIRPDSATFMKYHGIFLDPNNSSMLYVPEGCATGYLTIEDDSEIYYLTSEFYAPQAAHGIRFNDPAFKIEWPTQVSIISDNDNNWPDFGGVK